MPTTFTQTQWLVMRSQVGRCQCCGSTRNLCADHVVPASRGGRNVVLNIQVLCRSCNAKKATKTIDYRIASRMTKRAKK